MKYRKLSADGGDYSFGNGRADFWIDVPEAVAQSVQTRLFLFRGEWFLDSTEGTGWRTNVLGKYTSSTRDPEIRRRILGTQGLRSIITYSSALDRNTRAFSVDARIDTVYGVANISTPR